MAELEPHFAGLPSDARAILPRNPVHVMLDNLRSAFNVGSMFRTADACGVAHIHLCGMTAHPPHPKLEKTALGAFDYVPWTYHERNRDCVDLIKEQGLSLVGIETVDGAVPHHQSIHTLDLRHQDALQDANHPGVSISTVEHGFSPMCFF